MAIEAITVAMMDTGSSQMRDPPHGHKQRKQEPIEPLPILNQAVFQVPAAAFVILKRGLHAHAPRILAHAPTSCGQIGNQEPSLLVPWIPDGTHPGLNRLLILPEQNAPKPLLPLVADDILEGTRRRPAACHKPSAGMFLAHAQQIMEFPISTQLHQGIACQAAIRDQRTVRRFQMEADFIQQLAYQLPLGLIPFLLRWHDAPRHRQDPRVYQQSHIDNDRSVVKRRTVQHQLHRLSFPIRQYLREKWLPDLAHLDSLVSDEAPKASFDAGHLCLADPMQRNCFSHPLQDRTLREDDT